MNPREAASAAMCHRCGERHPLGTKCDGTPIPEPPAAYSQEPGTKNASVISWADRLLTIAAEGIEVELAFMPRRTWPHEAEETPEDERWQAWATTVPGTDMCQYGPHKAATPDAAMAALYAELYPAKEVEQ